MEQYQLIKDRFLDNNAPRIESKYMITTPVKFTGKTWVYEVISKSSLQVLGIIKWRAPWRQYWFEPKNKTGFSEGCLKDLAEFIGKLMEERKCLGIK